MTEEEYIKQYGMTKEEYIEKYFNKVNTLTAICRSTSTWAHGEYQELEIGKTYHVSYIGVLRSSSNIMLDEYGDKVYKAGCFDLCENGEPIGRKYTKDPRFLAPYLREMMRADRYPYFEKEIEKKAIPAHLQSIEKEYDVRILLAVDFGSRAWGVESKDSDWDLRIVYVHKPKWYKKDGQHDVIEHVYENCIDVLGWDVKKALTLFKHGNLSLLEWLNSPKAYYVDEDFAKRIHSVEKDLFNSANAIRYYNHFYEKNNESILKNDLCETKLFLYILRGILSCKWIEKNNSLPPILLNDLIETIVDDVDTKKKLNTIIKKKKEGKDDGLFVLVGFIRQLADKYKVHIEPNNPIDGRCVKSLDSLLLDTIQGKLKSAVSGEATSICKESNTNEIEVIGIDTLHEYCGKKGVTRVITSECNILYYANYKSFQDELNEVGACAYSYDPTPQKMVLQDSNKRVLKSYIAAFGFDDSAFNKVESIIFYDAYLDLNHKWYRHFSNNLFRYPSIKVGFGLRTIFDGNKYYVVDKNNNYVISPGKYDYIDGFNKHGYTRVMVKGKPNSLPNDCGYRCGIVDVFGNIILPIEYTSIQSFYKGCYNEIEVWEGGEDVDGEYQSHLYNYKFGILTKQLTPVGSCYYKRYEDYTVETAPDNSDEYSIWDAFEDNEEAAAAADFEW